MSCRAFSRQIEHRMLERLFGHWGVKEVEFAYRATDRNEPIRRFLNQFLEDLSPEEDHVLFADTFTERCPSLHSRVVEESHG